MNKSLIIKQTEAYVKETLADDSTGHDWWHIFRVWQSAKKIAQQEKADLFVVELAALLHDIADYKFHDGDESIGPKTAEHWLLKVGVDHKTIAQITAIIKGISFKGANVDTTLDSIEGQIVQDADRLDAIGAIGIARAFAYGGYKGRLMYDPTIKPEVYNTFEQYKQNTSPTINHFYEKLFLLKDLMNTETARKLAIDRHHFMEQFLQKFLAEWDGQDGV